MKIDNWGFWILSLNYLCFLIQTYSNWDIIGDIISKIKACFLKKMEKSKRDSTKFLEFQKIFSGCSLDIQIICIMRLLVMNFWRRWSLGPGNAFFYKNCNFEIVDTYQMNVWGIIVLIVMNVIILAFIMIYMKSKKIVLFFYKPYSLIANVFLFFCLHVLIEVQIQVSSSLVLNTPPSL
jgi:hypothetical protein